MDAWWGCKAASVPNQKLEFTAFTREAGEMTTNVLQKVYFYRFLGLEWISCGCQAQLGLLPGRFWLGVRSGYFGRTLRGVIPVLY
jgi:hypothetical protein